MPDRPIRLPDHCSDCFVRAFTPYSTTDVCNAEEVYRLRQETLRFQARDSIYVQDTPLRQYATLHDGWAFRFRALPNGTRAVLSILLPGDPVAVDALVSDRLPFSVDALTDCTLCVFDRVELGDYITQKPGLIRQAWDHGSRERWALQRQLVLLGRGSAYQRVALLLADLFQRLQARGMTEGNSFPFPLRQSHMADALGLTQVHISRIFGQLENDGLLRRRGRWIEIIDLTDLRDLQARIGIDSATDRAG